MKNYWKCVEQFARVKVNKKDSNEASERERERKFFISPNGDVTVYADATRFEHVMENFLLYYLFRGENSQCQGFVAHVERLSYRIKTRKSLMHSLKY